MRWLGVVFLGFAALCIAAIAIVVPRGTEPFLAGQRVGASFGGFLLLGGVLFAWLMATLGWVKGASRPVTRITWVLAVVGSVGNCGSCFMRNADPSADPSTNARPVVTKPPPVATPGDATTPPVPPTPVVPLTEGEIDEKLQLWCTSDALCQCLRSSFYALAPKDKRATMSLEEVDEGIRRVREECELRSDEMRKGVTVTCEDGNNTKAVRKQCACATSKFFEKVAVEDLREIRRDGWTNRTMLMLDEQKQRCEGAR
jgi:hypothetical protein